MPIYAYKCAACGFAKDVLRKMSDPLLTVCPSCQAEAFSKQVTAAGFQLKGSGWYVTDFRDGGKSASGASTETGAASEGAASSSTAGETSSAATPSATSTTPSGGGTAASSAPSASTASSD